MIMAAIAIVLALAIGAFLLVFPSRSKAVIAPQARSPLINPLQARTDIEAALEFEAREPARETESSFRSLQLDMQQNQNKFAKQYRSDFEKLISEIQAGWIHIQKEHQRHTVKANEKVQEWIKELADAKRNRLQEFVRKTNEDAMRGMQSEFQLMKQEIRSEMRRMEQPIQQEIMTTRRLLKEQIQKATLKLTPKETPIAAEPSTDPPDGFERRLREIETTETELQTNAFHELNQQLADARNAMARIRSHLEMLHLLHEMESEFNNESQLPSQ